MGSPVDHRVINIRPGVGMLSVFAHVNYKPWFALGEFVDNAIQSYLLNRERLLATSGPNYRLRITIELTSDDGGRLVVADNAAGIAAKDFDRAFVAAEPPPDRTGLSQFGMGMKSAGCWFARQFEVRSSALGEDVERTVFFDVERITREKSESLDVTEVPVDPDSHYTRLTLWNLHKPPVGRAIGKMKEHLESIYRVFLRSGEVEIRFNGELLRYEDPEILVAPDAAIENGANLTWRKELDFSLDPDHHVAGFAGLRRVGNTNQAGFALFRNRRLVQGSADEGYRPRLIFGASNSFRYQRLFGELHLTGFDVSYTKDGFLWGDAEDRLLDQLKSELNAAPLPLLLQAENFRSRTAAAPANNVEVALASTAAAVSGSGETLSAQIESGADSSELVPEPLPAQAPAAVRSLELEVAGIKWVVTLELVPGNDGGPWPDVYQEPVAEAGVRRMQVRIPLGHPFMTRFAGISLQQLEPLLRVAVGLALSEVTARAAGLKMAGTVRRNLDELLRGPLARPSTFVEVEAINES